MPDSRIKQSIRFKDLRYNGKEKERVKDLRYNGKEREREYIHPIFIKFHQEAKEKLGISILEITQINLRTKKLNSRGHQKL